MTLIEFFDKDTIKNILAVLTLEPDRVVYIYDDAIKDKKYFDALNKCFKKHIPQIRVEAVAVNNNSVSDIYEKTMKREGDYSDEKENRAGSAFIGGGLRIFRMRRRQNAVS